MCGKFVVFLSGGEGGFNRIVDPLAVVRIDEATIKHSIATCNFQTGKIPTYNQ